MHRHRCSRLDPSVSVTVGGPATWTIVAMLRIVPASLKVIGAGHYGRAEQGELTDIYSPSRR